MKIAINTNGLKHLPLSEAISAIQNLGCDHIELSTDGRCHAYKYIENPVGILQDCPDLQIDILSGGWCDFATGDVHQLPGQVEICRLLGCGSMRVFATNPRKEYDYEAVIGAVVDNLQLVADRYLDIQFLVENHGGLTSTGQACRRLMELVDRNNVGLVYDPTNYVVSGDDPIEALRQCSTWVKHVHGKNWREGQFRSVPDGVVDWVKVCDELTLMGYDSLVSIEHEGKDDPMGPLERSFEYLRRIYE